MSIAPCRNRRDRSRKIAGFSLLEMLVAFAIMALSLGLIYKMAGGSARHTGELIHNQNAIWLAQSLLAGQSRIPTGGWNETGTSEGYKWEVKSSPYSAAGSGQSAADGSGNTIALHRVQVTVSWDMDARPGQLELVTLLPEVKPVVGQGTR